MDAGRDTTATCTLTSGSEVQTCGTGRIASTRHLHRHRGRDRNASFHSSMKAPRTKELVPRDLENGKKKREGLPAHKITKWSSTRGSALKPGLTCRAESVVCLVASLACCLTLEELAFS